MEDRRSAPLDKVPAHDCHDKIRPRKGPCFFKVAAVAVVERIVFCNDGCCFHLFKHAVVACPPCVVPAFGTNNA